MLDQNKTDTNPSPEDFPVHWEKPEDANIFWMMDTAHHPDPVTPMDMSLLIAAISEEKKENYALPMRVSYRHINTYLYVGSTFKGNPEERDAQFEMALEKMTPVIEDPARHWKERWLPEIQSFVQDWENFDLLNASLPELLKHLEESRTRLGRAYEIHHLLVDPLLLAMDAFDEMFCELFEGAAPGAALELLSGAKSKTAQSDHALRELGRRARSSAPVYEILACGDTPPSRGDFGNMLAELSRSVEGQAFLEEWNRYLNEYGKRCYKLTLSEPFWIENPAPVIKTLQHYAAESGSDQGADLKKAEDSRQQALAKARQKLADYPGPVVEQFEMALKRAQAAFTLMSDHYFWIEDRISYLMRQVLLALGRTLAGSGCIKEPDDVFYLTFDEAKETALKLPEAPDLREEVQRRRALEERFAACTPPPFLGPFPTEPPPDNAYMRMVMKFLAGPAPAAAESPKNELKGHPGAPGSVQGTARVVLDLSDAEKIGPGEILVTRFTLPSWTPLFGTIAAVVTDSGGMLSHSAIVAREYGIPAVVGIETATSVIQDGTGIEVNGDAGIVRIIDDISPAPSTNEKKGNR